MPPGPLASVRRKDAPYFCFCSKSYLSKRLSPSRKRLVFQPFASAGQAHSAYQAVSRGLARNGRRNIALSLLPATAITGCCSTKAAPIVSPPETARQATIAGDAASIRAECDHASGGDWERWQAETAPYRAALAMRMDFNLPPVDGSAFFEINAQRRLAYLLGPADNLETFTAVNAWLAAKGIRLVVVPVPSMTELYPERFLPNPGAVIAPHKRREVLTLLEHGIEVVDLWPVFRDRRAEVLYNPDDHHWTFHGMDIAARILAERIGAAPGKPRYRLTTAQKDFAASGHGFFERALTLEQRAKAATVNVDRPTIERLAGDFYDPASPVAVMGDSYCRHFDEFVALRLNRPIRGLWVDGTSTERFGDYLREPELLAGVRVLVWAAGWNHLTEMKPLPRPILGAGKTETKDSFPVPVPETVGK
jgi:hypothetical protein